MKEYSEIENYIKSIKKEWKKFIDGKCITKSKIIRPIVLNSWKRSKSYNIKHNKVNKASLNSKQLNNKLKENDILVKESSLLLQILAESVKGSGFRIDLLSKDVYILKQWGDSEVIEKSFNSGSLPGTCKSEKCAGTNAMGLVDYLKIPVQLIGPEHYNINLHQWTCSAAPIKDNLGNIVGIINMTGDYKFIHKHTLGMVIATAKAIENYIDRGNMLRKLEIDNEYINIAIESSSDSILIIDEEGNIIKANSISEEILGLPEDAILNQSCNDIFGINNPFIEALNRREEIKEGEITLRINSRKKVFYSHFVPISIKTKAIKGIVVFLRKMKDVQKIAQKYSISKPRFYFEDLIGQDQDFKKSINLAKKAAKSDVRVLLSGETGSGKELFAQSIHNYSLRKNSPFISINSAAIPLELMESELFGYEEGAFTGAKKGGLLGKIEIADGGTLFLDEISSMPLSMQSKLLRFIETGIITRIGGREEISINVRIISASNKNLFEEIRRGNFREDLFYRINLVEIRIPPLRKRLMDIPLLITYFYNKKTGRHLKIEHIINSEALEMLMTYNWPGNIRELENVVERSLLINPKTKITIESLPQYITKKDNTYEKTNQIRTGKQKKLVKIEKQTILEVLKANDMNVTLTAKELGISRNTLYLKMKKYRIRKENNLSNDF
jgi:sigma-54 dependent transcriptional regulator, acetoin dehydrogenase operon transcriptional activator AcoR